MRVIECATELKTWKGIASERGLFFFVVLARLGVGRSLAQAESDEMEALGCC